MYMKIKEALEGKIKITPNKYFEAAPPKVELLPQAELCEDCFDVVVDRHIDYRLVKKPYKHWTSHCRTCSKYKNPETGQFDMDGHELRKYWYEHRNDK